MRRGPMLYCADVDEGRFRVLRQRGQLPFDPPAGREYTLDHSFRLRLLLDLIGGEDDGMGGLAPSTAAPIVSEVLQNTPRHPLQQIEPMDWWAGVVVLERTFENAIGEVESKRWPVTFGGEIEQFPAWLEETRQWEAPVGNGRSVTARYPAVRIFLANMSQAARLIHRRAEEIGINDPFDPEGIQ